MVVTNRMLTEKVIEMKYINMYYLLQLQLILHLLVNHCHILCVSGQGIIALGMYFLEAIFLLHYG